MKFVCLGYIDQTKFADLPPEVARRMMEECMAYDDELRRGGHFLGGEALDFATKAVTLRADGGLMPGGSSPRSDWSQGPNSPLRVAMSAGFTFSGGISHPRCNEPAVVTTPCGPSIW